MKPNGYKNLSMVGDILKFLTLVRFGNQHNSKLILLLNTFDFVIENSNIPKEALLNCYLGLTMLKVGQLLKAPIFCMVHPKNSNIHFLSFFFQAKA